MDTLGVKLIETGTIYTNMNFYTLILAGFAIMISGFTFIKQYGAGKLKIPAIRSFGMVGTSVANNPPTGFLFVLPTLFYVTGNEIIGVNDLRLVIRHKGEDNYFQFNHFVENLGISNVGGHQRPGTVDWAHQFTVHPKESIVKYIEFTGHVNSTTFMELMNERELRVFLEVKTTQNSYFRIMQSFGIKNIASANLNMTQQYVVYENDLYS